MRGSWRPLTARFEARGAAAEPADLRGALFGGVHRATEFGGPGVPGPGVFYSLPPWGMVWGILLGWEKGGVGLRVHTRKAKKALIGDSFHQARLRVPNVGAGSLSTLLDLVISCFPPDKHPGKLLSCIDTFKCNGLVHFVVAF